MDRIKEKILNNKKELITSFVFTFIWCFMAHAYIFLNTTISHDSLNEFVYIDDWKIAIGRFIAPIFKCLFGSKIAISWTSGILMAIFLSLSVFVLIKIFNIRSKIAILLISGILTVNITMIATASTYIHDLDVNTLSVLLAILGVYCWKNQKNGFLYASILCTLVLGIYQCNISIMITLIIMCSIMDLLHKVEYKTVILNGIKAIVMLVFGLIIYIALFKIVSVCLDISLKEEYIYNGLKSISFNFENLIKSYTTCIYGIINVVSIYPSIFTKFIHIILVSIMIIIMICFLKNKEYNIKAKILMAILILLIPFGMNITYCIDGGYAHDLMKYAFWFSYMFIIILINEWMRISQFKKIIGKIMYLCPYILIFCILWGNVQLANTTYLKKEIESKATLAYMNRVLGKIESYENYQQGITKVAFVGKPYSLNESIYGFENQYKITGNRSTFSINNIGDRMYYEAYFKYILLNQIQLAEEEKWNEIQMLEDVQKMECYPKEECLKMIDNVLVVKLGEV